MTTEDAERLEGLTQVDRAILAQGPHAVLRVILETACRLTNVEAAQLYRTSGPHFRLTITFPPDSPLATDPEGQSLSAVNSSCGIAISARHPLVVHDVRLHPNLYGRQTSPRFLSELVAPLWVDSEPIGVISLTSPKPNHFTPADVTTAQALSQQAAVAIVYADHLTLLDSLRQIDRAMLKEGASLANVGSVVLEGVVKLTQAEQGQILTVDWSAKTLTIIASTLGTDVGKQVLLDDSVCGDAIKINKPIRLRNWKKDERYRDKFKAILLRPT